MKIDPDFHRDYEDRCGILEDLGPVVERLIQELLRAAGIDAHSIRHRIKTKDSLQRKVGTKDASYDGLGDVHDLLGLRVITFFPGEVDRAAKVIEREFTIDHENSVDKRALLDPDRFGYLSLHYVASLDESRAQLTEHARFENQKFEIQIRSILQHAWAEIEHDLGYHTAGAIPDSFRRRFSRLAGLLEIADDEFETLRNEIAQYQSSVNKDISKAPESVPIDQDSILALIRSNKIIRDLDQRIAVTLQSTLVDGAPGAGATAARFKWTKVKTIGKLVDALSQRREIVEKFAEHWATKRGPANTDIWEGITLFYLVYVLIAESNDLEAVLAYVEDRGLGVPDEDGKRKSLAEDVLKTYDAAKAEVS